MDERDFVFDFIVNNLTLEHEDSIKFDQILIEVKFADVMLTIKTSRTDLTDFREGRSYEFKTTENKLLNEIENQPIEIIIKKSGNLIGELTFNWQENSLQKLCGENDGAHKTHTQLEENDIIMNGEKVGVLTAVMKLQRPKESQHYEGDGDEHEIETNPAGVICSELDNAIDPNDVLFVIGGIGTSNTNRNLRTNCIDSEAMEGLDFSRYQIVRGRLLRTADILNPYNDMSCEITSKTEPDSYVKEICGTNKQKHGRLCKADIHLLECPHSKKFNEICSSCCTTERSCLDDNPICVQPETTRYMKKRFCPCCGEDLTWLPKHRECMNCKSKKKQLLESCNGKIPKIIEDPITANTILKEWGTDIADIKNTNQITESRCTCRNGKLCPHCRINGVVKDLLNDIKVIKCNKLNETYKKPTHKDAILNSQKNENEIKKVLAEYEPEIENSNDAIPFLSQTLKALKLKYKIDSITKKVKSSNNKYGKKSKMDAYCEKQLQGNAHFKLKCKTRPEQNANNCKLYNNNNPNNNVVGDSGVATTTCYNKKKSGPIFNSPVTVKTCKIKRRRRKIPKRKYTGMTISHKTCQEQGPNVPKNMGWLWKTPTNQFRRGWRPGAIGKPIKQIMKHFLKDFPADTLLVSKYSKYKPVIKKENPDDFIQKPTLKVIKKNGEFLITMRPLKDKNEIQNCPNPYLNVKPIQFRIVKNPIIIHKREVKRILKCAGHMKCTCHMPIAFCYCRTYNEKEKLDADLEKVCCSRNIVNLKDHLVLSDTTESDSELDIEFTPPVGLIKPLLRKKNDIACKETQYTENDWKAPPILGRKNKKFIKEPEYPYHPDGTKNINYRVNAGLCKPIPILPGHLNSLQMKATLKGNCAAYELEKAKGAFCITPKPNYNFRFSNMGSKKNINSVCSKNVRQRGGNIGNKATGGASRSGSPEPNDILNCGGKSKPITQISPRNICGDRKQRTQIPESSRTQARNKRLKELMSLPPSNILKVERKGRGNNCVQHDIQQRNQNYCNQYDSNKNMNRYYDYQQQQEQQRQQQQQQPCHMETGQTSEQYFTNKIFSPISYEPIY